MSPDSGIVGTYVVATVSAPPVPGGGGSLWFAGNWTGALCSSPSEGTYICLYWVPVVPAGTYSVCFDYPEADENGTLSGSGTVCTDFSVIVTPTTTGFYECTGEQNYYDFWTDTWDCFVLVAPDHTGYNVTGEPMPSPTGSVVLTSTSPSGRFSPLTCELLQGYTSALGPSFCKFSYKDSYQGSIELSAAYESNETGYYAGSSASLVIPSVDIQCIPNPTAIGSDATCTATVTGNSPTGTIGFSAYSTTGSWTSSPECTLSPAGSCSATYTDTVPTSHLITATYSGDENNIMRVTNGTVTFVSEGLPTTTSVDCAPNPVGLGSETFCEATVQGSSPTGDVMFSSSSETGVFNGASCTIGPQTTCGLSYTDTTPGSFTITARYSGDVHNAGSNGSTELVITQSQSPSDTSVDCVPNPVGVGSEAICAVTVRGSNPTGSVTFSSSSPTGRFTSTVCKLMATGGCSVSYVDSEPGSVTITANYSGDSNNAASSASTHLTVVRSPSSLSVTCTPNPVAVGADSTCTAVVTGASPTGNVTFSSLSPTGKFSSQRCLISGGSCSVVFSDSVAGTDQILAVYSGDSTNGQASGSTNLVVQASVVTTAVQSKAPTTTTVSCYPNPVPASATGYDSDIQCTATVAGSSPSGVVVFASSPSGVFNGFYPQGQCTLDSSGTCHVTYWGAEETVITATYSGDATNAGSSGTVSVQIETRDPTSTHVYCVPNPVTEGANTICYASVSGGFLPTGLVKFTTDSPTGKFTPSADCTLIGTSWSESACQVKYVDTTSGSYTVRAVYQGDVSDLPSGDTVTLDVAPSSSTGTTTSITCSPNPVSEGARSTCTVTVKGAQTPTGAVSLTSDADIYGSFYPADSCILSSGTCTVSFDSMFSGQVTITALYNGNNGAASIGRFVLNVEPGQTPTTTVQSQLKVAQSGTSSSVEIAPGSLQSPVLVGGTIHPSQYTMFTFALDAANHILSFTFGVTGPEGATGAATFAVPKSDAPSQETPVVMIDSQYAADQNFSQDSSNFYVTFVTHFSNHTVQVQFVQPQVVTTAAASSSSPTSQGMSVAVELMLVIGLPLIVALLLVLMVRSRRGRMRTVMGGPDLRTGASSAGPPGLKFCSECGTPVAPQQAFCTNCGASIPSGQKPKAAQAGSNRGSL